MPSVIAEPDSPNTGSPISSGSFAALMDDLGSFKHGSRIAIAVSGGPDSMALCHLAKAWANIRGMSIVGLTVDHRLRPEAQVEAKQVSMWLADLGMLHETLIWEQGEEIKSLERSTQSAARDARFSLLFKWCQTNNIDALMTAHHADDQAETFLYRLVRGSGVDGLAAIAPESIRSDVRILRPLLRVPKTDLVATCEEKCQDWIEDPSNTSDASTRVRLRKIMAVLEQEGLSRDRLLKTVDHMARAKCAIDSAVDDLLNDASRQNDVGEISLDISAVVAAPEEVGLRCLARCLSCVSGAEYPPRFESLLGVYSAITDGNWSDRTLHGCQLRMKETQLKVSVEQRKP